MDTAPIICPLCHDPVDKLLYRFHLDGERQVIGRIKQHNPGWAEQDGSCSRCVDYYHTEVVMQQRILPEIGPHFPVRSADDYIILPTTLRLDADQRFTGKGITICFIDSGYYIHPDLVMHTNRIKTIIDITNPGATRDYFTQPHPESWHGTMTSVVCAGDGYLSNGLYKGIANNAELVLIKVQNEAGRITSHHIERALQWALDHHVEYNIRIVNMSVGGDEAISYKQSGIDALAEQLTQQGVVIVAAVGNDEQGAIKPPANSLSVIAVGGVDDSNDLDEGNWKLYHSSFGQTIDALMKPELIAHAIWIAAPILPGTREQRESQVLHQLLDTPVEQLPAILKQLIADTQLDPSLITDAGISSIKENILQRIQTCKYILPAYMHVDGTSFAAPIVSAIVAQLLEVNPSLTPVQVREILFSTAKRIRSLPAERQGFGVVHPRRSILKVLKREQHQQPGTSPLVNNLQHTIAFYIQHDCASQIALAGSFNDWAADVLLLEPGMNGLWKIEIPLLSAGRYQYKFFVDDKTWLEDVNNPYREPDGFSGFNSILLIENLQQ